MFKLMLKIKELKKQNRYLKDSLNHALKELEKVRDKIKSMDYSVHQAKKNEEHYKELGKQNIITLNNITSMEKFSRKLQHCKYEITDTIEQLEQNDRCRYPVNEHARARLMIAYDTVEKACEAFSDVMGPYNKVCELTKD